MDLSDCRNTYNMADIGKVLNMTRPKSGEQDAFTGGAGPVTFDVVALRKR